MGFGTEPKPPASAGLASEWPNPEDISQDDLERMWAEIATEFGDDAVRTLNTTVSGPLPAEVIEALRASSTPGAASANDFVASHEYLRRLVGDRRPRRRTAER